VPAELALHGFGNLALLQRIERFLEGRIVNARAGVPQITAIGSRTWVLRELLGQRRLQEWTSPLLIAWSDRINQKPSVWRLS
jgi:hypothetical protein